MSPRAVAGVDWAGSGWLAVYFEDQAFAGCAFEPSFAGLWEEGERPDVALVDVPIGLPDDEGTLIAREELDSRARSLTERPSSVFPVPSRGACTIAYETNASYEAVVSQNKADLGKGLTWQSYYIAAGIGEVDAFLQAEHSRSEWVIEAHPEVCFRALHGRPLAYGKDSAAGVGERLSALDSLIDSPGETFQNVTAVLPEESPEISVDDVLDAVVLAATASTGKEGLRYLPEAPKQDSTGLPIRMGYCGESLIV